ncbi:DUF3159 domain-containing protein [Kutzneria viridogrisea]|uniref:Integral membrane alanine and leucine rich protein n=2 Tax=Kutzneria TaxID=43356 RepID=W5WPV8_9PSEU|nr:DUF3159 domain-containing protein [Kutzneria albida]AHI00195.1 hypothetical protein KALB_6836 [Kutzneria albida DSM 43870]MBA8925371.1 hypothetical protein [Kutzneria viridogrisea]
MSEQQPAVPADEAQQDKPEKQPTLLEQMGGIAGLIYSSVPVVVFVVVNAIFDWQPAIWSAVGVAVAIAVLRLVRKQPLQPAISGLFGIAIAAFIVVRTGSAKGFFLFGIWTSLIYCGVFLVSALVRWPLAGVIWSTLNGTGFRWRSDRKATLYYDVATLVWILVFGSKFVVQNWLYDQDYVGLLGVARIAMGYPLTAVAIAVTVWAVRKADKRLAALEEERAAPVGGVADPTS